MSLNPRAPQFHSKSPCVVKESDEDKMYVCTPLAYEFPYTLRSIPIPSLQTPYLASPTSVSPYPNRYSPQPRDSSYLNATTESTLTPSKLAHRVLRFPAGEPVLKVHASSNSTATTSSLSTMSQMPLPLSHLRHMARAHFLSLLASPNSLWTSSSHNTFSYTRQVTHLLQISLCLWHTARGMGMSCNTYPVLPGISVGSS